MDYLKLYHENDDFRDYVDKEIKNTDRTVEEALTHKMVRIVGDYYVEEGANGSAADKRDS